MKQSLKWGGLILLAVVIGLGLAAVVNVAVRAQLPAVVRQGPVTQTTPYPYGYYSPGMMGSGMHGGMMSGYGWDYGYGAGPQGTLLPVDEDIQLEAVNFRFEPPSISIKAGETVRLVIANKDGVPHNLYGVDLPLAYVSLPVGVIRSVTFTAPASAGTY